jgi:hypothetical protein
MWKAIFTPHTNVPSTASVTGCPAVAGFLCDKASVVGDTKKKDPVLLVTTINLRFMDCITYI